MVCPINRVVDILVMILIVNLYIYIYTYNIDDELVSELMPGRNLLFIQISTFLAIRHGCMVIIL